MDTSVFGGLFDEEFKEFTEPLFDRISKDIMDLSPEEIVSYFEKKTKTEKRKSSA